jgi:transcriptional regulator with XRE-family HTH domain
MTSPFGLRLRQFREAKRLTLQQVADAVGCTKACVFRASVTGDFGIVTARFGRS